MKDAEAGEGAEPGDAPSMAQAVSQLTKLVKTLAKEPQEGVGL